MLVIKPVIDLGAPLGARHVDVLKSTQFSVVKSMVKGRTQNVEHRTQNKISNTRLLIRSTNFRVESKHLIFFYVLHSAFYVLVFRFLHDQDQPKYRDKRHGDDEKCVVKPEHVRLAQKLPVNSPVRR